MAKTKAVYSIQEVDFATGETVIREATPAEVTELEAAWNIESERVSAEFNARESAIAKLTDLGLTAEEIAAL